MADVPTPSASSTSSGAEEESTVSPEANETAQWIDANASNAGHLAETLAYLASITLPANPFRPDVPVNTFTKTLDLQLWPWNRAADRLAFNGHHREAAVINAGLYLAIISLQSKYRQRLHKGMPLCNLGFFLAGVGVHEFSFKAWLLGTAEDAFTNFETASTALSFRNLLAIGVPRPALNQYLSTLEARFVRLSTVPLMPEIVPGFWSNPLAEIPSEQVLQAVARIEATASEAYPNVPEHPLAVLEDAWNHLQLPHGVR
jgi:hypothetical protein